MSAKHASNTRSTASLAFLLLLLLLLPTPPNAAPRPGEEELVIPPPPPPQAGFIATDSAALLLAQACACALRPQFPLLASAPNEQSPESAAARTSEHAWWSQSDQSRFLPLQ